MQALSYAFFHPIHVILFLSFIAAALAAFAWGKSGTIIALALAPLWGATFTVGGTIATKLPDVTWDHINLHGIVTAFFYGTSGWLIAAIPGTLMGSAIRAILKRGQP